MVLTSLYCFSFAFRRICSARAYSARVAPRDRKHANKNQSMALMYSTRGRCSCEATETEVTARNAVIPAKKIIIKSFATFTKSEEMKSLSLNPEI